MSNESKIFCKGGIRVRQKSENSNEKTRKTKIEIVKAILSTVIRENRERNSGVSIYSISQDTKINAPSIKVYAELIAYIQRCPKIHLTRRTTKRGVGITLELERSVEREVDEEFIEFLAKRRMSLSSFNRLSNSKKKGLYAQFTETIAK